MSTESSVGKLAPVVAGAKVARAAGLRYVDDHGPGLRRIRKGKGFAYVDANGRPCTAKQVERIRRLVIPPAWQNVWICPIENGHIQATGRDARGRKQYRYHEQWRAVRDTSKYEKLVEFAEALPKVRARVAAALEDGSDPRMRLLAAVVRLLELTHIRVGNIEYARQNGSFGLTTLKDQHVRVHGSTIEFRFRGKSGVKRYLVLDDRQLARLVRKCQELPGEELFQYRTSDGRYRRIGSADVNEFLKTATGMPITAKDFRTWTGTVWAARTLAAMPAPTSATEAKKRIREAIVEVAKRLGNTPAVCRRCYVHPVVVSSYEEGRLAEAMAVRALRRAGSAHALTPEERAVLQLLAAGALSKAAKAA